MQFKKDPYVLIYLYQLQFLNLHSQLKKSSFLYFLLILDSYPEKAQQIYQNQNL